MRKATFAISLTFLILMSTLFVNETVFSPTKVLTANAATTNHFVITGYPTSVVAGQSFSGITDTAYSSNGQVLTSYTEGQVKPH